MRTSMISTTCGNMSARDTKDGITPPNQFDTLVVQIMLAFYSWLIACFLHQSAYLSHKNACLYLFSKKEICLNIFHKNYSLIQKDIQLNISLSGKYKLQIAVQCNIIQTPITEYKHFSVYRCVTSMLTLYFILNSFILKN